MNQHVDLDLAKGMNQLAVRIMAIVVSLAIGATVALAAVAFFKVVAVANGFWAVALPHDWAIGGWHYAWPVGLALLVSALIAGQILKRLDNGRPHGPADLIHFAQHDKPADLRAGLLSSVLALNNLSGGASVGLFGPLVHFGGCVSAWLQRNSSRLPRDVVLGSGAGAAIAAVFSAPIGAALFAHEAIIRRFGAFGPGPALACSFAAYWVSEQLLGQHRFFKVDDVPELDAQHLLIALVVGIASALVSMLYIYAVTEMPRLAKASGIPLTWRPLVPALLLFLISPVLPHLLGSGLESINLAMGGKLALTLLVVLLVSKILITSLCLGFGYFGGVFGPALFIGAMLGAIVDLALTHSGMVASSFVMLGAASCVATVIGAPMAATVIVFEMTGSYEWAVLSLVSVVVAAQISRSFMGRSLFDRQLASRGIVVKDDRHRGFLPQA
jgi:CIC family chloride channel protein